MSFTKNNLFDEFPEVSAKQWKQKIQFDLKGKDFNDTLVWHSLEGIDVKPFYTIEDLQNGIHVPLVKEWQIQESVIVENIVDAKKKLLSLVALEIARIKLVLKSDVDFELLFSGVDLSNVSLVIDVKFLDVEFLLALQEYLKNSKINHSICVDIIGNLATTGNWYSSLSDDHKSLDSLLNSGGNISIGIDVGLYQNSGANMIQQIAYALAHCNEYLNHFSSQNISRKLHLIFNVAYAGNYFFEIAKTRALRSLMDTLISAYSDLKVSFTVEAIPSLRNKTLYDYNVNMLRTTTECMSAILGGADVIENRSYDVVFHERNDFGDRIARNQLFILKEESYFDKVKNPAEGSYYISSLTGQLAEKALELFKSIENGGGFLVQLKNHTIQKKIKESALKEQAMFDEGKIYAVGTNVFPNKEDRMKNEIRQAIFPKKNVRKTLIEPILVRRLSEKWEKQRLFSES
ncbi:methylmalonyl-CoA mutase [Pustulibacterium marinum]|uniref:Methylmalonyl-CoA mutase n=1 Tax=Pustulibacterium marinum TaxID=1224947 RepID=A0A1I7H9H1_9FLAO|nr:methylmalonyl-CoA mutase subunit beta [Pustulibacterium marinum]SFU57365.1 methylmalonyl-CoA mutase [Pustulibacterium marinum]